VGHGRFSLESVVRREVDFSIASGHSSKGVLPTVACLSVTVKSTGPLRSVAK
jgi:hypothetical protein